MRNLYHPVVASIIVAIIFAGFVSAETSEGDCGPIDLSAFPMELPNRAELLEDVEQLLLAHCHCQFPPAIKDHLFLNGDPRFESVDEIFATPPECFGELNIGFVKFFDEISAGHVVLDPQTLDVAARYSAVEFTFYFVDDSWVYTWPKGVEYWDSDCE